MKRVYGLMVIALLLPATAEARRTHVTIHKVPPHATMQPVVVPLIVVPPFAMAIDLIRRTSCDPAIAVATGPDDPGFTSHPVGNYLVPAIYRSECHVIPSQR
jgi:hypothetical protein